LEHESSIGKDSFFPEPAVSCVICWGAIVPKRSKKNLFRHFFRKSNFRFFWLFLHAPPLVFWMILTSKKVVFTQEIYWRILNLK
jgi:hypothetical protein